MNDEIISSDTQQDVIKPRSRKKQWMFLFLPFTLLVIVIGAIITPTICRNIERSRIEHERSQNARCRNNLKQLSLAIKQYAMDYADHFPNGDNTKGLGKLYGTYITDFSYFCCPSAKTGFFNGKLTNQNISYVYFGDFMETSSDCCPPNKHCPVVFDRPENHKDHINYIDAYGLFETLPSKAKTCSEFIEEMNNKFKYHHTILKTLREKAAEADRRYYSQEK
jgi:hypothetical protein